ncbi:4'-phosphopantetheinyl transferase family protein [Flavobacterium caseinilyticum]|uniref:4'-phosphopantetheinyl transferase superfamily protein n=1 Tax=Flavobacterium caseinilyticum TaxID=2541732 RepID=A0A4R5B1K6_9FLAO|nr:4'-phosphopantetheinyl transferase superfamily protein [Flavobacterium caseinilyticum]TDD78509.1 4'-phosphopantetheinyl transferase superfamily protein [Flavobacterium caseinilyticum]
MPLFKTINFNSTTQILIWKITEPFSELNQQIVLNESNQVRLKGMKSEMHQRAFLSVRKLLQKAGYEDLDVYYDTFGKPHLYDGKHISITHSHEFSAIIISDETVGIDIELQRVKIMKIAHKFCNSEFQFLAEDSANENKQQYIRKLTVIWGAKEAIFKIRNEKGISFKEHITVYDFNLNVKQNKSQLHFENKIQDFAVHFEEIDDFTLVYAFEN